MVFQGAGCRSARQKSTGRRVMSQKFPFVFKGGLATVKRQSGLLTCELSPSSEVGSGARSSCSPLAQQEPLSEQINVVAISDAEVSRYLCRGVAKDIEDIAKFLSRQRS
jgi:hypothetical protein